jgi:VWFA-related protein
MRTARRGHAVVLILLILPIAVAWLLAQDKAQIPGAIRVRVTLVPIDVVVTDQDDRPVTDLKQEDFTILENGVRQPIGHFSYQGLAPMTVQSGSEKALLRKVPTAELSPETRRTFLIVLGRGRLQDVSNGIDALIRFVRKDLLPQDLVAVLAWNRATDFSTDHEKVAELLERFKKQHTSVESKMASRFSGLAAVYGSKEIPASLQPEINKVFEVPGGIGTRQLPPGRVTDAGKIAEDARTVTDQMQRAGVNDVGQSTSPFEALQADSLTDLPFDEFISSNAQTTQDLQNLYTAIEYLRYVEGEKHLLFFSEKGLFLPRLEHDQSLAAMANDARVTVDTFQTGGVDLPPVFSAANSGPLAGGGAGAGSAAPRRPGAPPQPRSTVPPAPGQQAAAAGPRASFSQMFALASLREIARLTGGRASIHSNIDTALSRLNEVTRGEYLLGYYPRNSDWNGQYRRIVVRVTRPGLKLYYRRGYYARQSVQPFDRRAFLSYSRISAAGQYQEEVKDLNVKVHARAVAAQSGGEQEAELDVIVGYEKVPFHEEGGLHKANLAITVFYGDGRGRYLGDSWQEVALNLREATWLRAQKEGIAFSTRVPLRVADQQFKVVVYSYDADRIGSVITKVK